PPRETKKRRLIEAAPSFFQPGAATTSALSACTICLGRNPHNVFSCSAETLWDGVTPAHCSKNDKGRLLNPAGTTLCSDWQRKAGCSSSSHDSKHECSGCGKPTHGAQTCPRGQKA
ncbi:hypothetical protein B0H34DRAFT_662306, partial [Crassisporium funariophilum]